VSLVGPFDVEGHLGTDGRFYLIDTARLFPPTAPNLLRKNDSGIQYLYNRMRPELVKIYPHPLSSEAFSKARRVNESKLDSLCIEATEFLLYNVIPNFAAHLDSTFNLTNNAKQTKLLHDEILRESRLRGINMRLLSSLSLIVHPLIIDILDY